jgi:hypothetical protein
LGGTSEGHLVLLASAISASCGCSGVPSSPPFSLLLFPQGCPSEEEGGGPSAFGECWGPGGEPLKQPKIHPRLEGRVQSPPGDMFRTEVKEGRGCWND